jgi:DNA recombination protein RmuC
MTFSTIIACLAGLVIGWLVGTLRSAGKTARLEAELSTERDRTESRGEDETRLREMFEALASQALKSNSETFVRQTRDQLESVHKQIKGDWSLQHEQFSKLIQPVEKNLKTLDEQVRNMEQKREGAYKTLEQHIGELKVAHGELRDETGHLRQALTTGSRARGRWGELQLRRIVELTGMLKHVDFEEQVHEGGQRPDMLIRMPNERDIPVDAKTTLEDYMKSIDATDEASRKQHLKNHARALRARLQSLGNKEYWKQFEPMPEVVVMFVPNESCLSAAFDEDAELLEFGLRQHVLLATPVTLYALLKAIAYGWQQQDLAENARKIADEGRVLIDRIATFIGHMQKTGRGLSSAVDSYNKAVGSLETRVVPSARKLKDLGATNTEIEATTQIEHSIRLPVGSEEDDLAESAGS